mmetsp:Transcript_7357/g.13039  ORF Transcript_7357/g.13039 Transcript_7357/m.13039 type:complete len:471 (-) Transcript_7357:22-1434(-)
MDYERPLATQEGDLTPRTPLSEGASEVSGTLHVTVLSVSGASLNIDVPRASTVHDIKRRIAEAWSIPLSLQDIIHGTEGLEESTPLQRLVDAASDVLSVMVVVSCNNMVKTLQSKISLSSRKGVLNDLQQWGANGPRLTEEALSAICSCLADYEWTIRRAALMTLAVVSPKGHRGIIDRAVDRLTDRDQAVRHAAINAIAAVAPQGDSQTIAAVVGCLEHWIPQVRQAALGALSFVAGKGNSFATQAVVQLLEHDNWNVRVVAVEALALVAEAGDAEAIISVADLLTHDKCSSRQAAIDALGVIGKGSPVAANAVLACLNHPSKDARKAAATALHHVAGKGDLQVVGSLIDQVTHSNSNGHKQNALEALFNVAQCGEVEVLAVATLLCRDEDESIRTTASALLESWTRLDAVAVIAGLAELLDDHRWNVVGAAFDYLQLLRTSGVVATQEGGLDIRGSVDEVIALHCVPL